MSAPEVHVAQTSTRRLAVALGASLLLASLSACGSMPKPRWPFGAKPVPPPAAVEELAFEAVAYPQYWKRNTLVIDLQSAPAAGSTTFSPKTPAGWPVRLAVRVRPGVFAALEIEGEQRAVLPVSAAAQGPVDLELDPAIYRSSTPAITVRWGALAGTP